MHIVWRLVVRVCNPSDACSNQSTYYIATRLHELKTALDASKGEWTCKYGGSIDALGADFHVFFSGVRGTKLNPHTIITQIHQNTQGKK